MIGIVDYEVGNIKSIQNALLYADKTQDIQIIDKPEDLKKCSKIILPGVGAFENAIEKIKSTGFNMAIGEAVDEGKILLGICLGMQLLATKSYEFGEFDGLNLIEGEVLPFKDVIDERVPHIGWNEVNFKEDKLFDEIPDPSDFYFVHSFYYKCSDENHAIGETEYGIKFSSVIKKENVYGVQFHPEKSQRDGLQFIANFLSLA